MDGFLSYMKATVNAVGEELKQQAALLSDESTGITYVGRQLLACGFPHDDSARVNGATVALPVPSHSALTVRQLASFLHKHHEDKFMVWNLSEKTYDYAPLDNQVIEFKFAGYPSCPLSQVFSLCNSIHAWLQADAANVAVLHCQTGRGRTVCALASYLAWTGQLPSVHAALQHVTAKMNLPLSVIIPTQQRYLDYLSTILSSPTQPNSAPILLERVLMNGIPKLGDRVPGSSQQEEACRPYLQIFKDAQLIYTSTGRDSTSLRWYTAADSSVLFPVGLELEGDILIRIRHLSSDNKRVSMLRFGFHTGFVNAGNTRFVKAQLDGAATDSRFGADFFLDLVFRAANEPDASTDEGKKAKETQSAQAQWWEQIQSARKQMALTQPDTLGSPSPPAAATDVPAQSAVGAAAATSPPGAAASASSGFWPSSLITPQKSKPSLGSLFSSASSKLSTLSLWGSSSAANDSATNAEEASHMSSAGLDLSNPEVRRLHEADQEAMRKAKRRAATEAAVAAALQLSPNASRRVAVPASASASASVGAKHPTGADPDSFADLQAYVAGLGSIDQQQLEIDSDDDSNSTHARSTNSATASASKQNKPSDIDLLDSAMQEHFSHDKPTPASATSAATTSDDDVFASLRDGLPTSPVKIASAPNNSKEEMSAEDAAAASLEAELAALSAEDLAAGGGDSLTLNDDDEAALLASLQDELGDA